MTRRDLALVFAAVLALDVAASPVFAQKVAEVIVRAPAPLPPGAEVKREVVKFGDLDLRQPAGAETLTGRIRAAAERVCEPSPRHLASFKDVDDYRSCLNGAMNGAVMEVGAPMVQHILERTGY